MSAAVARALEGGASFRMAVAAAYAVHLSPARPGDAPLSLAQLERKDRAGGDSRYIIAAGGPFAVPFVQIKLGAFDGTGPEPPAPRP